MCQPHVVLNQETCPFHPDNEAGVLHIHVQLLCWPLALPVLAIGRAAAIQGLKVKLYGDVKYRCLTSVADTEDVLLTKWRCWQPEKGVANALVASAEAFCATVLVNVVGLVAAALGRRDEGP